MIARSVIARSVIARSVIARSAIVRSAIVRSAIVRSAIVRSVAAHLAVFLVATHPMAYPTSGHLFADCYLVVAVAGPSAVSMPLLLFLG